VISKKRTVLFLTVYCIYFFIFFKTRINSRSRRYSCVRIVIRILEDQPGFITVYSSGIYSFQWTLDMSIKCIRAQIDTIRGRTRYHSGSLVQKTCPEAFHNFIIYVQLTVTNFMYVAYRNFGVSSGTNQGAYV
jgi:hypothetical protein